MSFDLATGQARQKFLRQQFCALERMPRCTLRRHGFTLTIKCPKPTNHLQFLLHYYYVLDQYIGKMFPNQFQRSQVYETLKNAAAHGGDAILAIRKYQAIRMGYPMMLHEVIVWDNGPGISDIKKALRPGYTSQQGHDYNDFFGQGKGIDLIIGEDPTCFAADEIMIECGRRQVFRRHKTDAYHSCTQTNYIQGCRVTLRFWHHFNKSYTQTGLPVDQHRLHPHQVQETMVGYPIFD